MTTSLTIANTTIRQDEHGRFCLNDLHVASGGAEPNGPKYWLKSKQTCELRDEFPIGGIPPITATRGRYGGTYAVKELVYAYAMWVSPKFHLAVIRAYDALVVNGGARAAAPTADLSTMPRSEMLDHFQLLLSHARDAEAKRLELEGELDPVPFVPARGNAIASSTRPDANPRTGARATAITVVTASRARSADSTRTWPTFTLAVTPRTTTQQL